MLLIRLVAFCTATALCCTAALAQVRPPAKAPERAAPPKAETPPLKFEIGKETTIEQPGLADGHFILYVPETTRPSGPGR